MEDTVYPSLAVRAELYRGTTDSLGAQWKGF